MRRRDDDLRHTDDSAFMAGLDAIGARLIGRESVAIYRVRGGRMLAVRDRKGGFDVLATLSDSATTDTIVARLHGWAVTDPRPWPMRQPHPGFGGSPAMGRTVEGLPSGQVRIDTLLVPADYADAMACELMLAADHARDLAARKAGRGP